MGDQDDGAAALDLLSELHHLIGSERGLGEFLGAAAERLVRDFGARAAQIWIPAADGTMTLAARAGEERDVPPGAMEAAAADDSVRQLGDEHLTLAGGGVAGMRAVVAVWTDDPPQGIWRRVLDLFAEHAALAVVDDQGRSSTSDALVETARSAGSLAALVEATDAGILMIDTEGRLVFANERVERILDIPLRSMIGEPAERLMAEIGKFRFAEADAHEARVREELRNPSAPTRQRLELADGRIVERYAAPVQGSGGTLLGRVTVFRDVTARERLIAELSGLVELSTVFAAPLELPDLLDRAQRSIARIARVTNVALWRHDPARRSLGLYAPAFGFEPAAASIAYEPEGPMVDETLSGRAFTSDDVLEDDRLAVSREQLSGLGVRSMAAVPLQQRGRVTGLLVVCDPVDGRAWRDQDVRLLMVLASQLAPFLENAELFERQREIASSLQHGLIPTELPQLSGLRVAARYFSATSGAEVGGDLFDVFRLGKREALFIADVSGKGIAAASTAALVKHGLRAFASRESGGHRILSYLNRTVAEQGQGQFVTALFGLFDPETRRLALTAAGHPPPLRVRPDGTVDELEARGPALGIIEDARYAPIPVDLKPGDMLLLYTDGLVECRNDGDQYGLERLMAALGRRGESPEAVADALIHEASEFCGGAFGDDVALLVCEVL